MKAARIEEWLKEWLGGFYNPFIVVFKVVFIIFVSFLLIKLGTYIIKKVFDKRRKSGNILDEKKVNTMSTLLVSVFSYTVYIIAGVVILTDVFNLTSVLAAAGIGGLAVGLGAQSLIRDIISGFFIVLEDQYAVGDLITIDNLTGSVEEMELRVTKIRNFNGDLYIIPNGEIKKVINHTRGNKAVIVDIPLAYSSDINKAFGLAEQVCVRVTNEFETIVEPAKVLGITELGRNGLNIRIFAKTVPNAQWEVERRIRKLIKEEYSRENIRFFDRDRVIHDGGEDIHNA